MAIPHNFIFINMLPRPKDIYIDICYNLMFFDAAKDNHFAYTILIHKVSFFL